MKKYLPALAMIVILALPGITLAGGLGTYSTTVLWDGASLQYIVPWSSNIIIDVYVSAPASLDGCQYTITASKNGVPHGGDNDWIYDPLLPYMHLNMFQPCDYFTGVGYGSLNGLPLSAPYNAGIAESYMTFATAPVPGSTPPGGPLARYNIQLVPGMWAWGDTYVFTADNDPAGVYLSNGWVSMADSLLYGPWDQVNGLTVIIYPEPASLLLMLGAIPFLRRRR